MPVLRTVMLVWAAVGLGPFFLQLRGFAKFATPHKITESLITPADAVTETTDLLKICPVTSLFFAGARWNACPTHYFRLNNRILCHIVVPQYNAHGGYFITNRTTIPHDTSPSSCADDSSPFDGNFYHGSIGFYSMYAEMSGTFCSSDDTAYLTVSGVGTYDINGLPLANDRGGFGYRKSYWYIFTGTAFILLRVFTLRRSFVSCWQFAKLCDQMTEPIRIKEAVVYVQESMRLSAHGAKNLNRILLLFLLVDQGVMSDFFLLSTQEGLFGRIQSISLGYNLAGLMSMLFEMVETMNWMSEKLRCQMKRLLFNYETALVGEFITAAALQHYLTTLSHSQLKDTQPVAELVSYYLMGLAGHIVLALGCLSIIVSTRAIGAIGFVWWRFGTTRVLTKTCSVDAALGARCKLAVLGGYIWEDGELYYRPDILKALGVLKAVEPDGRELLIHSTLHWISIPHDNFTVIGTVDGRKAESTPERPCSGIVGFVDRELGGDAGTFGNEGGGTLLPRTNGPARRCCFRRQSERINCSMDVQGGPDQTTTRVQFSQEDRQIAPTREFSGNIQVFGTPQQNLAEGRIELKSTSS